MEKDFDAWNEEKKAVNERMGTAIFFREQEIWWSHFGLNVGKEQDGKGARFLRPVLVLKKFSPEMLYALPLTTKDRMRSYLIPCQGLDGVFRQANITQMKLLDSRRLIEKMTFVPENRFLEIRKAVRDLF